MYKKYIEALTDTPVGKTNQNQAKQKKKKKNLDCFMVIQKRSKIHDRPLSKKKIKTEIFPKAATLTRTYL